MEAMSEAMSEAVEEETAATETTIGETPLNKTESPHSEHTLRAVTFRRTDTSEAQAMANRSKSSDVGSNLSLADYASTDGQKSPVGVHRDDSGHQGYSTDDVRKSSENIQKSSDNIHKSSQSIYKSSESMQGRKVIRARKHEFPDQGTVRSVSPSSQTSLLDSKIQYPELLRKGYRIITLVGKGATSTVWQGEKDNKAVAVKIINLRIQPKDIERFTRREIAVLK
jgi:hypothetical protein